MKVIEEIQEKASLDFISSISAIAGTPFYVSIYLRYMESSILLDRESA